VLATGVWALLSKVFWHDVLHFAATTAPISTSHLPYRDYVWEFPPLSLLPVFAAHAAGPAFTAVFVGSMIACEYASLEVLRRSFPGRARRIALWWHACVLPLATFTWFRLDFLAVAAASAGLVALVRDRPVTRWAVAGFAAKVWPIVLVAGLAVRRRVRDAVVATAGAVAVLGAWWLWSPSGFASFLAYRRGSGLQVESTLGSLRLLMGAHVSVVSGAWVVGGQGGWGWVDPAGLAVVGAAGLAALVASRRRSVEAVRLCAALTVLMLVTSRILSPQYLVWVAPFAVLLAATGDRVSGRLFAVAVALTMVPLIDYDAFLAGQRALAAAVAARNMVLWALAAWLFVESFRRTGVELEVEALSPVRAP